MEFGVLKEMVAVVRVEQQRRASLRADQEPAPANDQWLFVDEPFVNELCLMLLVALRHQVEKALVRLAARAADKGDEISRKQYEEREEQLRKPGGWDWNVIHDRLETKHCEGYEPMKALRLLANSYKHDPSTQPDEDLLKFLKLESGANYAPLAESDAVRERLADLIGLGQDAAYCDIADGFADSMGSFLMNVRNRAALSPVRWGPLSLNPRDFAR